MKSTAYRPSWILMDSARVNIWVWRDSWQCQDQECIQRDLTQRSSWHPAFQWTAGDGEDSQSKRERRAKVQPCILVSGDFGRLGKCGLIGKVTTVADRQFICSGRLRKAWPLKRRIWTHTFYLRQLQRMIIVTRVLASTTSPDVFLGCFYAVFVALTPSRSVFPG